MSCCESIELSSIPCCLCKGQVYEFSVPNDVWNLIIRQGGPETNREYLCWSCFARAAADRIDVLELVIHNAAMTFSATDVLYVAEAAGVAIVKADEKAKAGAQT